MKRRGGWLAAAAAMLALAMACGEEKKSGGSGGILGDLVERETVRIQADQGGEVALAETGGSAEFQANALSDDTDVTNAAYEAGEPLEEEAASYVFNVTTSTPVGLNGTYTIRVPYDGGKLAQGRVLKLRHQPYITPEGGGEAEPRGEITDVEGFRDDRENFVVTADVNSFGAYWVSAVPSAGGFRLDAGSQAEPPRPDEERLDAGGEPVPEPRPDMGAEMPPKADMGA